MQSVINNLWKLLIYIWKQQNTELHGTDSVLSLEQNWNKTAMEAKHIYENTIWVTFQLETWIQAPLWTQMTQQ
jgi:hypothetical protein